ncbi:1,2-dihydroxy-3-keto-5-methylthiopentene dioxygenase [Perkinsus olseni]|uniref:acireductone dioxygenase (Fe(2+)-requiring) n=1 Tax=Perkinsus olseni TaxID=32597 RepID=A0A7J6L178_PEROL|nr:1,2-dihydroxy-3-keto-5-methylthiopentene dioxygenase [Perkinsus olseni]
MAFSLDVANLTAWYLPDDDEIVKQNPARPHMTDEKVSQKQLANFGVLAAEVNQPKAWDEEANLKQIRKNRGYQAHDTVDCSNLSDDTKVKFFTEHLHVDEEIRLITNGIGHVTFTAEVMARFHTVKNAAFVKHRGHYESLRIFNRHPAVSEESLSTLAELVYVYCSVGLDDQLKSLMSFLMKYIRRMYNGYDRVAQLGA